MTIKLCLQSFLVVALSLAGSVAQARLPGEPAKSDELKAISTRGRQLALMQHYKDEAATLLASKKDQYSKSGTGTISGGNDLSVIVQLSPDKKAATVAFGRLGANHETYFIDFIVSATSHGQKILTKSPPLEDTGYFRDAAIALATARECLDLVARGYAYLILPATKDRFYVYFYPQSKDKDTYLLGGDERFLLSVKENKAQLIEQRQLHKSILTYPIKQDKASNARALVSMHSAIIDEVPEDTDVMHVLTRKPALPEFVATANYLYYIKADGSIKYNGKISDAINHTKKPR